MDCQCGHSQDRHRTAFGHEDGGVCLTCNCYHFEPKQAPPDDLSDLPDMTDEEVRDFIQNDLLGTLRKPS